MTTMTHAMHSVLRLVLQTLAQHTCVDIEVWNDVLQVLDPENNSNLLSSVFSIVLQSGRLDLIELFCERGMNPFSTSDHNPAPPIFGLVKAKNLEVGYSSIFIAIFDGMQKHFMKKLAGLKEYDFDPNHSYENLEWSDTGNLLQRAIAENPALAHFIIDHSDANVEDGQGWNPALESILEGEESILRKLMMKGLDPTRNGRRYIKMAESDNHAKGGSLTRRKISQVFWNDQWWDSTDCYDLASITKKSMSDQLLNFRQAYLDSQKGSLEENNADLGAQEETKV